jgi:hypothetical protein
MGGLSGEMVNIGTGDGLAHLFVQHDVRGCSFSEWLVPIEDPTGYPELAVHRNAKHEVPPTRRLLQIKEALVVISNHPMVTDLRRKLDGAAKPQLERCDRIDIVGYPVRIRMGQNACIHVECPVISYCSYVSLVSD